MVQILQLFKNISYLDLGEGEAGEAWASCCRGCRAVDQGSGSQVESSIKFPSEVALKAASYL